MDHLSSTHFSNLSCWMPLAVTADAKRNQVVHHVATELAPAFYVMDLQASYGTALLAPPAVSFEHACPDDCVFFRIQFESGSFLA